MPAISGSAPGKAILFGEHAVVYARPAIAIPVTRVYAKAIITPLPRAKPGSILVDAPDIDLNARLSELEPDHPFNVLFSNLLAELGVSSSPAINLRIKSTIPIAAGLGSGAAISIAIVRAFSMFLGHPLPDDRVSNLAFLTEKFYHGTPSGIDNTVITYAQPIYFIREQPFEKLNVSHPFTLIIADSGIKSPTAETVGNVRQWWLADQERYEHLFDQIAALVKQARVCIESGETDDLGSLMLENHSILQKVGVSSPTLDQLVSAAMAAGALGAKLSGGGRGGNIICLVKKQNAAQVEAALKADGAVNTISTTVP